MRRPVDSSARRVPARPPSSRAGKPLTSRVTPRTICRGQPSARPSGRSSVKEESLVGSGGGELLVIMSEGSTAEGGAELPGRFPIVHTVSPRVFVIEPPGDVSSTDVAALPGVAAVSERDVAPEILEGLDETEGLFVQAWSKRQGESKTQRRGEGLDWDADGFEPPDPPSDLEFDNRSVE